MSIVDSPLWVLLRAPFIPTAPAWGCADLLDAVAVIVYAR